MFPNISNRLAYDRQCFLPMGLSDYLKRHASAFDVAHLHACRNLPGVIAARHLRAAGVPYVLAPNGTAPNLERRRAAKRLFDAVARDAGDERAPPGSSRSPRPNGGNSRDWVWRPNASASCQIPLALEEFEPPPVESASDSPGVEGPLVAYLGKLTPRKRVDVLVRAFAQLRVATARWSSRATTWAAATRPARRCISWAWKAARFSPGCCRAARAWSCWPAPTSSSIRPSTKSSGSCRSKRCSPARRSSLPTTQGAAKSSPRWAAVSSSRATPLRFGRRSITSSPRPHTGARLPRKPPDGSRTTRDRRRLRTARRGVPRNGGCAMTGVSFVVPVHNGGAHLAETLASIAAQADGRPMEIIVVEDGSQDDSAALLQSLASVYPLIVMAGPRRGAAAAVNAGVRLRRSDRLPGRSGCRARTRWMAALVACAR